MPSHKTRKVLISPSFGAGWSTWADLELRDDFLFDPELIEALESGQDRGAAVAEFAKRMKLKHPEGDAYYDGGGRNLVVKEVHGPFIVDEYDGSEIIQTRDDMEWI